MKLRSVKKFTAIILASIALNAVAQTYVTTGDAIACTDLGGARDPWGYIMQKPSNTKTNDWLGNIGCMLVKENLEVAVINTYRSTTYGTLLLNGRAIGNFYFPYASIKNKSSGEKYP